MSCIDNKIPDLKSRRITAAEAALRVIARGQCFICNSPWPEDVMIKNHLWWKVMRYFNIKNRYGIFLCWRCIEEGLQRSLTVDDLIDCPMNAPIRRGYTMGLQEGPPKPKRARKTNNTGVK